MKYKLVVLLVAVTSIYVGQIQSQTLNVPSGTAGIGSSTNGNVGIGTTNPIDRLSIHAPFSQSGIYEVSGIYFSTTNGINSWGVAQITPFIASNDGRTVGYPGGLAFKTKNPDGLSTSSPTTKMVIDANGNVGIGISTVNNDQGWNRVLDIAGSGHSKLLVRSNNVKTGIFSHETWNGTVGRIGTESNHDLRLMAGYGNDVITLTTGGKVGIGTTTPDQALTVKGKIHTNEVIIDLNGPVADYVFKPTYKLMPLSEVEQFVKTNSHLPEIPSATEITKNGLSMGEMQNKLVQKVEELTLYAIQQNKEIAEQRKDRKELEKKYNALLEKIEMLTKQIEKR